MDKGILENTIDRQPRFVDVVSFEIVDPEAAAGDYRSAGNPSPYVSLADPAEDIEMMRGADEVVVDRPSIRVLYSYPFGVPGPSPLEQALDGWVFEEKAPGGKSFTRADVAKAISDRYNAIYAEERETSGVAERYIPGMLNRAPTFGKYHIWGHTLGDLLLHTIRYDAGHDVYDLGIDS